MDTPTPAPKPTVKPFWTSKTFWLNTIALATTLIPPVGVWVTQNPVSIVSALAGLNVLLRFITSDKISIGWDTNSGAGGTMVWLAVLGCTGLGLCGLSLTSCSLIPLGTSGTVYYLDRSTGAKAGLTLQDGVGTGTLYVPVYDESGDVVGRANLEVPIQATK